MLCCTGCPTGRSSEPRTVSPAHVLFALAGSHGVLFADLLPYRVSHADLRRMKPALAAFYADQNAQIDDLLTMERHIHNVTADVRRPVAGTESDISSDALFYHNAILPLSNEGQRHLRLLLDRHLIVAIRQSPRSVRARRRRSGTDRLFMQ